MIGKPRLELIMLGGLVASFFLLGARTRYRGETWKVIAWNDLGMHCMDSDSSVSSILPPFNAIHAQVLDPKGKLIQASTGIKVTYEAMADPGGCINKTSNGKTNYWKHAKQLYGGITLDRRQVVCGAPWGRQSVATEASPCSAGIVMGP